MMRLRSFALLAGLALPLLAHGAERCIAMADAATGEWLVHEGRCDLRMPPMSTFKVPLSLMGYDSGVLRDAHAPRLPFKEGYVDWNAAWRQPTDPAAWMRHSVVWYSQQLTGVLGEERFHAYVKRFNYGNGDVRGDAGKRNGLTHSWLASSLRISPDEQVAFLRRVVNRELGLAPEALEKTSALMKAADLVDGWQIYGKTGSGIPVLADGRPDPARRLGWYVGWMSKGERRIVFAQMAVSAAMDDAAPAGMEVREEFLRQLPARVSGEAARVRAVVDAAIAPLMAEYGMPGMAVAVTVDGKPYFFNYGVASLESRVPVSERTLFELGSVSKTFTATLATYAQALGKLSLSDAPSRHLRELDGSAIDKATLLHLGTYVAGGLPMQFPRSVSKDDITHYFLHFTPTAAPGTRRLYSNPSIGLFGQAAARALERDFASALEHLVFPKFGLGSTYVNVPAAAMAHYAWGYDGSRPTRVNPGPFDAQAYGVKSTSADLLRFVQANIDPAGLDPQMRRAVQDTHVPHFQVGPLMQGLGWEQYLYPVKLEQLLAGSEMNGGAFAAKAMPVMPAKQATLFHKTGSTGGFGAYAVFVPERRVGIVMLANMFYPNAARIRAAHAMLSQLAP